MSILMWTGVILFVTVYIVISTELLNKTVIAMLGASIFMGVGLISEESAFQAIDWNVIFLLVSMMIIVGITKQTGLFQYAAIRTAKAARGNPVRILISLSLITAVFSAFLDNVTTVLIMTPVTILIAVELGISPVPFIISEAVASNIGGTATLIGDPPNIIIGSAAHLSFLDFVWNLAPVVLVLLVLFSGIAYLMFRKSLVVTNERRARIMEFDESRLIEDRPLLYKSLAVLAMVIIGFVLHGILHIEAAVVALFGASLLMLLTGTREIDRFFHEIEWGTIFFFVGLFVLVGALVDLGVIGMISRRVLALTEGNVRNTSLIIVWASGFLSAFVDNIPYVATMTPLIQDISRAVGPEAARPLWWALSLGACLGGNGTLVGASANVVAAGIAGKSGYPISFMTFTRYGIIFMLVSLTVSTGYIWIRYFSI